MEFNPDDMEMNISKYKNSLMMPIGYIETNKIYLKQYQNMLMKMIIKGYPKYKLYTIYKVN